MRKGSATAADRAVLQAKLAAIKAEQEKVGEEKKALALKTETLRRSLSNIEAGGTAPKAATSPRTPSSSAAPSPAVARVPLNRGLSDIDRQIEAEKRKLAAMEGEAKRKESASALSSKDDLMEQMLRKAEGEAVRKESERREEKALEVERRQEEMLRKAEEEAVRNEAVRQAATAKAKEAEDNRREAKEVVKEEESGESESDDVTSSDSDEAGGREALQVPLAELQEALRSMSSEIAARSDGAIVRLCGVATRLAIQMVESDRDADFASSVQMLIVDLNRQMVALLKSRYEAECLADAEDVISSTLRVLGSGMMTQ